MAGVGNLFGGKSVDVLRVLLVNYPKEWNLRDLSREAKVALGWTSKVAETLIRERLAVRDSKKSPLRIMAPFDLLKRWAAVNNFAANTQFVEFYSPQEEISKFFAQLKEKNGPDYAFTALAGGLLVAPFVRPTNVHLYVKAEEDARKWAKLLSLLPVEQNGNVRFAIPKSNSVFYGAKDIDGVRVVSDIQLYVDLLNYPARGEEAAQAVLRTIEKRWKKS
ncbi:MAG: type IV toxin-antitoxin system AbiEi family antitoxin [Candidatus Micrarchaeota archaeon]